MKLKIGTRKSDLALWQANTVKGLLSEIGIQSELVEIESFGDQVQDIPLHKLGDKGVFTKALDVALLSKQIDLAVHSLKDVPTELEEGLTLASVPMREDPRDVLVGNKDADKHRYSKIVATGSIRRKAFWLNKYPGFEVSDLRGNVPTRLKKIEESEWKGAVFAMAGLKRLGLADQVTEILDWMLPAPSQGAIGIVSRDEKEITDILTKIEDTDVRHCVDTEREFLNTLEAGCSSPVGALTRIEGQKLLFKGAVLSKDGSERLDIEDEIAIHEFTPGWGEKIASRIIEMGALKLMNDEE